MRISAFHTTGFSLWLSFIPRKSLTASSPALDQYLTEEQSEGDINRYEGTSRSYLRDNLPSSPIEIFVNNGMVHTESSEAEDFNGQRQGELPHLEKRVKVYEDPPTQINQAKCPPNHQFMYSWCHRAEGTRAWTIACSRESPNFEDTQTVSFDDCPGEMLCIDGTEFPDTAEQGYNKQTATCFDGEYFVALSKNMVETTVPGLTGEARQSDEAAAPPLNRPSTNTTILTGIAPPRGGRLSLEALLTNEDRRTVVSAMHMELWAQTADKRRSYEAWRAVAKGHQSCDDCCSLALWDVPPNTQRLDIDAELPPQVNNGLLFFYNGPSG